MVYNKRLKYIFLLILTLDLIKLQILLIGKKNVNELKKRMIKQYDFIEFFNNTINKKTVLIFEPRDCHNECTPGYTKYFIDLENKGYIKREKIEDDKRQYKITLTDKSRELIPVFREINYNWDEQVGLNDLGDDFLISLSKLLENASNVVVK